MNIPDMIKQYKKENKIDEAIALLFQCIEETEAQSKKDKCGVVPWCYKELADIYHKRKQFTDEIEVLERFSMVKHSPGVWPERLLERLRLLKTIIVIKDENRTAKTKEDIVKIICNIDSKLEKAKSKSVLEYVHLFEVIENQLFNDGLYDLAYKYSSSFENFCRDNEYWELRALRKTFQTSILLLEERYISWMEAYIYAGLMKSYSILKYNQEYKQNKAIAYPFQFQKKEIKAILEKATTKDIISKIEELLKKEYESFSVLSINRINDIHDILKNGIEQ